MDLITHIPGIANSAPFTPGVNTPSPWHVSHTGLTDGTSPNNATKNMAQIYNRLLLERAAIIQAGGLTIDNNNWAQTVAAIRMMIGNNFGGLCPNTGPASPPTEANPFSIYKSDLGEYWMWLGDAWKVVAGLYYQNVFTASVSQVAGVTKAICSLTAPRNGLAQIRAILSTLNASAGSNQAESYITRTRSGSTVTIADSLAEYTTVATNQYSQTRSLCTYSVQAGDVFTLIAFSTVAMNPSPQNDSSIYLQYIS